MTDPKDGAAARGTVDPAELPEHLRGYFAELDRYDVEATIAHFSPDCLYAVPGVARWRPGMVDAGPRAAVRGREALAGRFSDRGRMNHFHEFSALAGTGDRWILEGIGRDGDTGETTVTFCSSVTLDEEGLVRRYLAFFAAPPLPPVPARIELGPGVSAGAALRGLYEARARGDADAVAAALAPEAVLALPRAAGEDSELLLARAEELGDRVPGFRDDTSYDPGLVFERGSHALFEGQIAGPDGTVLASAAVDAAGRIVRLAEFVCVPEAP
ncbi:MAG TPA: hypothetical protein VHS74_02390 [Solirubrobacterales bacterium]|jgi:ketosteroid isomerase-like protein|nr:hypothetical protein [Solirubrobacterales bacterium]